MVQNMEVEVWLLICKRVILSCFINRETILGCELNTENMVKQGLY